jgi:hypothetical protein
MGQQGFDASRLTMGQKVVLVSGALFFILLFLPWESISFGGFGGVSANGFNGLGVLAGILVILLLVWEGMNAAGVNLNMNVSPALVGAILAGATVLFGLIRALLALTRSGTDPGIGAWLGLVALIALAYGAWLRFQESKSMTTGTVPPPM